MDTLPRGDPPPYSPPVTNPPTAPTVIKPPTIFGPNSMQVTCTNCNQLVTTSIAHEFGSCTIIAAVTIFIFCFPCFWIPLVCDSCKDVHHMCPSCNALLDFPCIFYMLPATFTMVLMKFMLGLKKSQLIKTCECEAS